MGPRLRASQEGALLKKRQELETCGGGGFFPKTEIDRAHSPAYIQICGVWNSCLEGIFDISL